MTLLLLRRYRKDHKMQNILTIVRCHAASGFLRQIAAETSGNYYTIITDKSRDTGPKSRADVTRIKIHCPRD